MKKNKKFKFPSVLNVKQGSPPVNFPFILASSKTMCPKSQLFNCSLVHRFYFAYRWSVWRIMRTEEETDGIFKMQKYQERDKVRNHNCYYRSSKMFVYISIAPFLGSLSH